MKLTTYFLVLVLFLFAFLVENALADSSLQLRKKILPNETKNCATSEIYLKFNHQYENNSSVIYAMSKMIGAETDLVTYPNQMALPLGDSKVYRISFTDEDWGTVFGVVHKVNPSEALKITSICEVTTTCSCVERYCARHISTNGTNCSIEEEHETGTPGTLENPFIIKLT